MKFVRSFIKILPSQKYVLPIFGQQHLKQKNIFQLETLRTFTTTNNQQNSTTGATQHGGTINDNQINLFTTGNSTWWDPNGPYKMLYSMNQVRVPFIQNNLQRCGLLDKDFANTDTPLKNLNIVDIGCGGGYLSEALSKLGANVTGIDACEDLINIAKSHAENNPGIKNDIKYIYGPVEDFTDEYKNKFDVVISSECVEHVENPKYFVDSCTKMLKPGGSIFITTINQTNWGWLIMIVAYEKIFRLIPKGMHEWEKLIPLDWLKDILVNNKCETKNVAGFKYKWYSNTWILHSDPSAHYALHAVKNK